MLSGLHALAAHDGAALDLTHTELRHVVEDVAALSVKGVRLVVRKAQRAQPVPVRGEERRPAVEAHRGIAIHVGVVLEPACVRSS